MRIAWFGHRGTRRGNGLVTYSTEVTRILREHGHDVVFFYHGAGGRDRHDRNHIRIGAFNLFDRGVITMPDASRVIAQVLRERHVEVAHASLSWSLLDFALADVCHENRVPIVATLHVPYDRRLTIWGGISRSLYRFYATFLGRFDRVIIFSDEQRRMLEHMGVPGERIAIIPNGVDTTLFRPEASDFKQSIDAETVILFLGRLDPEKNVGALIDAFMAVDPPPQTKLVIVGTGLEAGLLRAKAAGDRRIIFTGQISDVRERLRILRGSDIFVLPSSMEGLSLAMLEAMATGLCVIATDVGSDGEALQGAGIVIDPGNLDAQLRLALEMTLTYPEFRRHLGQLARQRAVERFTMQENIRRLTELYHLVRTSYVREGE